MYMIIAIRQIRPQSGSRVESWNIRLLFSINLVADCIYAITNKFSQMTALLWVPSSYVKYCREVPQ